MMTVCRPSAFASGRIGQYSTRLQPALELPDSTQSLAKLGIVGKTTLVDHEPTLALVLSGRNIPGLSVVADTHLTVYDVLDCQNLVVSQQALDKLEERLTP